MSGAGISSSYDNWKCSDESNKDIVLNQDYETCIDRWNGTLADDVAEFVRVMSNKEDFLGEFEYEWFQEWLLDTFKYYLK